MKNYEELEINLDIIYRKIDIFQSVIDWLNKAIEYNLMVNEKESNYKLEYLVIQKPNIKDKEEMKCFERILIKILAEIGYYLRDCNFEEWEALIYEDKRRISKRNKNVNR